MAIDTAEKRRAVGGIPFLPLGVNVTPNVAKDVEWRQQAAWSYPGIAPNPPTPPVISTDAQSAFYESALNKSAFKSSPIAPSAFSPDPRRAGS